MHQEKRLRRFLEGKSLSLVEKVARGFSSEIFLVKDRFKRRFALKIERDDSPRKHMVEKEINNLQLANSAGSGPRLVDYDLEKRIVLMEFIEGQTFHDWLFSNPSKKGLEIFLKELFRKARQLDEIGLDHGQLAGKGKNILVRKGKPVIIDFEKASSLRKPHNLTQLESFIYKNPNGAVARKVKEIMNGNSEPEFPVNLVD